MLLLIFIINPKAFLSKVKPKGKVWANQLENDIWKDIIGEDVKNEWKIRLYNDYAIAVVSREKFNLLGETENKIQEIQEIEKNIREEVLNNESIKDKKIDKIDVYIHCLSFVERGITGRKSKIDNIDITWYAYTTAGWVTEGNVKKEVEVIIRKIRTSKSYE